VGRRAPRAPRAPRNPQEVREASQVKDASCGKQRPISNGTSKADKDEIKAERRKNIKKVDVLEMWIQAWSLVRPAGE
jgi:hypothetical protein